MSICDTSRSPHLAIMRCMAKFSVTVLRVICGNTRVLRCVPPDIRYIDVNFYWDTAEATQRRAATGPPGILCISCSMNLPDMEHRCVRGNRTLHHPMCMAYQKEKECRRSIDCSSHGGTVVCFALFEALFYAAARVQVGVQKSVQSLHGG